MVSAITYPAITSIVIQNVQTIIRSTLFSNSTQAMRQLISRVLHQPTLGELLAGSDNSRFDQQPASAHTWQFWPRSPFDDPTPYSQRTIDTHLYLALGSLGLCSVGLLGVPLLTLISVPAQAYFVARFIQGSLREVIGQRRVGMVTIDALVTSSLLGLGYFWAVALYASCFYWSRRMLWQSSNRYQDSIWLKANMLPRRVRVRRDTTETWIDLENLDAADIIVVYAGEVLPVDGIVITGLARIDQQILTGDATPVERSVGEQVFAMTLLLAGRLQIHSAQTGTNTLAARIGVLLHDMRNYTSSLMVRFAAIGDRYALPLLVLGSGTLLWLGPISALAILCAYLGATMRITGPLTVLNHLQLAAQSQILLKDGTALEVLHTVDTVIFDQTSTLMQAQLEVVNIYAYAGHSEDEVLALAAAAEQHQMHPIAGAILQAAEERCLVIRANSDESYEPGIGVHTRIAGERVHVVGARFLEHTGMMLPLSAEAIQAYCYQRGHSLVYVVLGSRVIGTIELAPNLRPEAQQVIAELQQLGKQVVIVSGDHEQPVLRLAHLLQADAYYAGMLPLEKVRLIERLQQRGKTVCFVGNGLNDALAMKQANVAVSLQHGTGMALDAAQICFLNSDLSHLLPLFDLARRLHTSLQSNLAASIIPGVVTLAGVYLFHFGVVAAYVLYYTGFSVGISNAMLPLMKSFEHE